METLKNKECKHDLPKLKNEIDKAVHLKVAPISLDEIQKIMMPRKKKDIARDQRIKDISDSIAARLAPMIDKTADSYRPYVNSYADIEKSNIKKELSKLAERDPEFFLEVLSRQAHDGIMIAFTPRDGKPAQEMWDVFNVAMEKLVQQGKWHVILRELPAHLQSSIFSWWPNTPQYKYDAMRNLALKDPEKLLYDFHDRLQELADHKDPFLIWTLETMIAKMPVAFIRLLQRSEERKDENLHGHNYDRDFADVLRSTKDECLKKLLTDMEDMYRISKNGRDQVKERVK